jgi:uncharacterized protein (DUF2132 family)
MGEEKASIIIQKNWRRYKIRKMYLKIKERMKKNKKDDF